GAAVPTLNRRARPAVVEHSEDDVNPEATAVPTRSAGVGRQLEALHVPRVARLPDLDRAEARRRLCRMDEAARSVPTDMRPLSDGMRRPVAPGLSVVGAYSPPGDAAVAAAARGG